MIVDLINVLKEQKLKIATAESCTGGLLAKKITDISGSSEVFDMGLVSYANRIKQEYLGVPAEVLETKGAVSYETAEAMARGIVRAADADIGVGITGIAGPGGGTPEKPVGTVFYGLYFRREEKLLVEELHLKGNREEIRESTTKIVIERILRELRK
ncbi:MAG: CinA family protein [Clostridia bacterium]|nr:CinA family protein [Clostridia bacterium]